MARDLPLARIRQAAAMSAREYRGSAQVKLRHTSPAGSAADICAAAEPASCTVEVASCPHERHALVDGSPLATSFKGQHHSIGFNPHVDATQGLVVARPGPCKSLASMPQQALSMPFAHVHGEATLAGSASAISGSAMPFKHPPASAVRRAPRVGNVGPSAHRLGRGTRSRPPTRAWTKRLCTVLAYIEAGTLIRPRIPRCDPPVSGACLWRWFSRSHPFANATRDGGFPPLMINPIDGADSGSMTSPAGPQQKLDFENLATF
jgi:hypothetical protein